jgi:hypothetical protein
MPGHQTRLAVAAIVAAAVGVPTYSAASTTPPAPATSAVRGSFLSVCEYSHRAKDDPIVKSGMPGMSHSHDFAGNKTTNASSDLASLRAGATTCDRAQDTAAYWAPTLYDAGVATSPRVIRAYYRPAIVDQTKVKPFPAGLKMVAGDATATKPQPLGVSAWACSVDGPEVPVGKVPTCPSDSPLRLRIVFPSCWDGMRLDSPDHKSHMAYPTRQACPPDHPVAVPQLTFSIRYRVAGGAAIALACGNEYCGHADFFNAWKSGKQESLVRSCIDGGVLCGSPSAPPDPSSA